MSVAHILGAKGRNVVTTTPDKSLFEAAQLMSEKRIGAVIVCDRNGAIAGILSERDIMRCVAIHGAAALEERVSSHMTKAVETTTADRTVVSLMERMTLGRFRHMPVVENGALIGIVSVGDLIKFRLGELEHEREALKDYIASA